MIWRAESYEFGLPFFDFEDNNFNLLVFKKKKKIRFTFVYDCFNVLHTWVLERIYSFDSR